MKEIDFAQLNYSGWSFQQWVLQKVVRVMMKLIARIDIQGFENLPVQGPVVAAINHLHIFDMTVFFTIAPRRTICFVSDNWETKPGFGWFLSTIGQVIWVNIREKEETKNKSNRQALRKGLTVLQSGGILGVAPEGRRSVEGLKEGLPGIAYLANRSSAPIATVVAYGQEHAMQYWKRLRRVPISVRFGPLITLPDRKMKTDELQKETGQVMKALAQLLPPEYRGVYEEKV